MDRSPRAEAIRALPGAVSLLLLLLLAVHSPPSRGLKYGIRAVDLKSIETVFESRFFSRISSWRNSTVGGHPWQVSLKLGGHHFCGGSLIQDDLVVTAVHCLIGLNEKQIKSLTVTAGEYNLFQKDKEEQNIPVSKIIIHPEYNRRGYMSFNIALLYLKLKVKFGTTVQPICIPHRGDKFEEGIFCMASGWGKISETSEYSNILQEVEVPIMDDRTCGAMLRAMNLPPLGRDMLCASFPDGEKDACQRDSGGPLVCRRDDGAWVLAGITSWAAGCTRVWNPFRNKQRKASPGIFSKVFVLMDFITQTMTDSLNKIGSTSFPKTNPRSSAKVIPYGVCGIPPFSPQWLSRRIAGGVEACPHCWPWQVGLRFLGNHQCGGAIINSIWILTAAHCVQSKNNPLFWTIVAGDHDRTLKESTEQVRRAKHIVMHEDFDSLSYDSDIALIQLSSALEFNSVVRPVCLPHSLEPLFSSEICVVTGWGSASKDGGLASRLQQIQVPVLEREVCERTYYSAHPGGISEKMICAGFAASGGKDVGQGDSGGPLVCKHEKGPFVLYGIVSWGAGCAQPRKPGVFARVSVFLDWIQSKIKDAGPVLLQIKNESKILTRQQLPPPTPSRDSASGPGCYSEVELEEPRGFFSSPRYPLDYRGKLECSWVLRVSPSSMAKFTVEYLLLPGSHMCQDSALIIYEENHSERRMSGKLCGRRLYPVVFMSSGPLVRVTFHSSVQGAFGINYIVFRVQGPKGSKSTQSLQSSNQEHVATCEDVILTKPAGIIQFPRYFHRTIMSCHWRLLAPINHIIRLDIISFQKQPVPLACQGDLWVYEGFGSGKKLIGNLCEGDSPSLKSHGPLMMLIFTYNASLAMEEFSLRYSFHMSGSMRGNIKVNGKEDKGGCPILDLIAVSSFEITSPNYPNIYPNMLNCTWTFYSISGNKMKALIKDFIMEESWNCEWDYFNIYDGPDQQSRLLAHLCGSKKEFVWISSGAYLTVNLKTDESVGERGFKLILEDMTQKPSQKRNIGIQLPINGLTVENNTRRQPAQDSCGVPFVDPFLSEGFERNTNILPAEVGEPRVVGGRAAAVMSWPWLVSLQHQGHHYCGGALIGRRWVLTAAHCNFSTVTDYLVIGRSYLGNIRNSDLIPVKAVYIHPSFTQFPPNDDLSLLHLEKPVELGEFVSTICLPGKDDKINLLSKCLTAGWGITEPHQDEFPKTVQQAKVPLISSISCRSYWGLEIKNTNICGGASGSSSCMGDSGGPLQCGEGGQYKLIGIVSWGSSNCHPAAPTVFTRISAYTDWITSITGGEAGSLGDQPGGTVITSGKGNT
ncbi:ovochymase-1 isoform X1 [Bubalus bubalis]|uniref:ovochymase-1 isoform X1 n=1 Tax=Bubalus bubalis TaxID=89462 RepID=UPI001E1B685D|nr:ovochymase-1 isoform X1 [Bubalus bubalis]